MKKVVIALAAIVTMASCKKQSVETPQPVKEKKIAKFVDIYNGGTPETSEFTYDDQGRMLKEVTDYSIFECTYPSASGFVVTKKNKSTGNIQQTMEYTVNSEGRATKLVAKNAAGMITYTNNYTYDAAGFMIRSETQDISGTYYFEYTINNGNCVMQKYYNNGALSATSVFTLSAQPAVLSYAHSGQFPSRTLFGKPNSHPFAEMKTTNAAGTVTWHTKTSYQLDADGYVTSLTTNNILLGVQGTITYTYQ